MSSQPIQELLGVAVQWEATGASRCTYEATAYGRRYELRLNDFPEEHLFTVTVDDHSLDLDDLPQQWKLPPRDRP